MYSLFILSISWLRHDGHPKRTLMWLARKIVNRWLPRWWRNRIDLESASIESLLIRAARDLPIPAMILDAGSGQSPYRRFFTGHRYIAVDFARGEATWDYSQLDAVGMLEQLPLPDNTFDAVLSTQVLEHVPEPQKVVDEMFRVLKPGGTLYLSAPLGFGEHQIPYDFYRYTRFGLQHILDNAGFNISLLEPRGGYFCYMAVISMWFYLYLFPQTRSLILKFLLFPLQLLAATWFIFIWPPIVSAFDFLDKEKSITLGYAVIAKKPPNMHNNAA
ncbi:class I SAM-dependent methyltransferase [bacterium]|nr:class I SAM-dependent methyltransferase [candidate division CSSED10-310 bacterium]